MSSLQSMKAHPTYQRSSHDSSSASVDSHQRPNRPTKTPHPLIQLMSEIDNAVLSFFLHPHHSTPGHTRTIHLRQLRKRLRLTLLAVFLIIALLVARPYIWSPRLGSDDETVFEPFTNRRSYSKLKGVLKNKYSESNSRTANVDTQLYYPPNCPWGVQMCAKIIPSFIFAGGELCGSNYIYNTLLQHPQVLDNVKTNGHSVFDSDHYEGSSAFESYLSKFPYLDSDDLHTMTTDKTGKKRSIISGENAPHYLYKSHLTAKRIRETMPHVKLIFVLRDPIDRAYAQYLEAGHATSGISFETFMNVELQILRRCGHTSTQTGWTGFVQCHQGSEVRASWNMNIPLDGPEPDRRAADRPHGFDSLARGMYSNSLEPFIKHFPPSQILVIRSEDFVHDPSQSFQRIARFLGIDDSVFSQQHFPRHWQLSENELFGNGRVPLNLDNGAGVEQLNPPLGGYHHHHHYHGHDPTLARPNNPAPAKESQPTSTTESNQVQPDPETASPETKEENKELGLSTRYRLQKVFRSLNNRLVDMFEAKEKEFSGWEYDVDRG
ncbi:P-loop containing nucleoside triphosphate hydrolase protein [Umbelopsis sp. AD052]|nr:P-loop containing nucleoside triphosphate hydrolase protein [Umbelopsis sp. AD052]